MRRLLTQHDMVAYVFFWWVAGAFVPADLLATVLPANGTEEDSPSLGDGYDSVFKTKKWGCVAGTVNEDINQSISSELQFASNMALDKVVNSLEAGTQLSLNKYFFNLRANAQLMNAHSASETSTTFHFFWRGNGKTVSLNHDSAAPLAEAVASIQAIKHFDDEQTSQEDNLVHVRAACGDEFVSEIRYGAYLIVTLKINFATSEDKSRFDAEIQAGMPEAVDSQASNVAGPSSKPQKIKADAAVGLSANIGGKLIDLNRNHSLRSSSVEVIVNQVGGDPTAISKILGSNAINGKLITECTGTNDLDQCVQGFSEAVAYAQDFLKSLSGSQQNLWSPMVYFTTPYTSVLTLASSDLFLLSENRVVSDDLERRIEQLDLFLDRVHAIELKATNLLKAIDNDFYNVDQDVRSNLRDIKDKARRVHIDIKNGIYHTCTKKSSLCEAKIDQFEQRYSFPYQLDIDERYLNLKPELGGVQHAQVLAGTAEGGKAFDHSDNIVNPSERSVVEISLMGSQRPTKLSLTLDDETILSAGSGKASEQEYYLNPFDPTAVPIAIGKPATASTHSLVLHAGEQVSYVEAHTGVVDGSRRVVYIKICKSDTRFEPRKACIETGKPEKDQSKIEKRVFQANERLVGFYGHHGREIDELGLLVAKKPSLVPSSL